jgi:DNA-binding PadR family transcriptional regulator
MGKKLRGLDERVLCLMQLMDPKPMAGSDFINVTHELSAFVYGSMERLLAAEFVIRSEERTAGKLVRVNYFLTEKGRAHKYGDRYGK